MLYRGLADLTVLVHFAFVLFVVGGAFLVLRWRRLAWVHVPAAIWGALIEFAGWVCPLTPLENRLRASGGSAGYRGGFVEHYIIPVLYPRGLTREIQIALGMIVIAINIGIYGWLLYQRRKSRGVGGH
jgi:hypothetical protein